MIAFVLTFLVFYPFAFLAIDIHHDGVPWKPALDVAQGMAIYAETFTQYGALTVWLHALFIKILGPSLYSVKFATLFFYSLTGAVLYRFWSLFLSQKWVWVCFALWLLHAPFTQPGIVFLPWASVISLFFQVLSAYALAKAFYQPAASGRSFFWMGMAGVSAGLCFWARNPVGAALILGWLVVVLIGLISSKARQKDLCLLLVGLLLGFGLPWLELYRTHAVHAWIEQNWIWPAQWAESKDGFNLERVVHYLVRHRYPALFQLALLILGSVLLKTKLAGLQSKGKWILAAFFGTAVFFRFGFEPWVYTSGIFTVIPLLAGLTGIWIGFDFFKGKIQSDELLLNMSLVVLVGTSWSQFFPVNDARHVYWAITPAFGCFAYWLRSRWFADAKVSLILFGIWLISVMAHQLPGAKIKLTSIYRQIDHPSLKGIWIETPMADQIEPIFKKGLELSRISGWKPVIFDGPDPFYNMVTLDPRHPHPLYMRWGHGLTKEIFGAKTLDFVSRNDAWLILESESKTLEVQPPGYQKNTWIQDPTRGIEVSLWVKN